MAKKTINLAFLILLIFQLLAPQISLADNVEEIEEETGCSDVYSYLSFASKNKTIISEYNSQSILYPASLTKVMTLYLTFEAVKKGKIRLGDMITVSGRGEEMSAVNKITTLKLKEGDKISVRQAIRGTLIKSFNGAAVSLAEKVAGDEWKFVRLMNEKAKELGMRNTSFRNATGLHHPGQYSNAYDLARLTIAIIQDFPRYYHLFSRKDFKYKGKKYRSHNHVLQNYRWAEGLKTGFTRASGFNLISSAKKNNNRIVAVLLACASYEERDEFMMEILDDSFKRASKFKKNNFYSKLLSSKSALKSSYKNNYQYKYLNIR